MEENAIPMGGIFGNPSEFLQQTGNQNISRRLVGPRNGRVLIVENLGTSLETAKKLDQLCCSVFCEQEIDE